MPNSKSLKEMCLQNELLPCSVPGCPNSRYRLYSTCLKHRQRQRKYGHPRALSVPRKVLTRELKEVREIVLKNVGTHAGLSKAIEWFDKWMKDAAEGASGVPGQYHFKRLHDSGVGGAQLLIATAAVFIYAYRNPQAVPSDSKFKDAAIDYAMAHQTTKLIPLEYLTTASGKKRARFMSSKDRAEIGQTIRSVLGPLYLNILRTLNAKEEKAKEWTNEMCKGLK